MKLFDAIGEFLKTLFVPAQVTAKKKKPGPQTHGGFSDGFQKAPNARVNLTGVTPALIVVPEDKPEAPPKPDDEFLASVDDLPLDAVSAPSEAPSAPANEATIAASEVPAASSSESPTNDSTSALLASMNAVSEAPAMSSGDPTNESTSALLATMSAVIDAPPNEAASAPAETASNEAPVASSTDLPSENA